MVRRNRPLENRVKRLRDKRCRIEGDKIESDRGPHEAQAPLLLWKRPKKRTLPSTVPASESARKSVRTSGGRRDVVKTDGDDVLLETDEVLPPSDSERGESDEGMHVVKFSIGNCAHPVIAVETDDNNGSDGPVSDGDDEGVSSSASIRRSVLSPLSDAQHDSLDDKINIILRYNTVWLQHDGDMTNGLVEMLRREFGRSPATIRRTVHQWRTNQSKGFFRQEGSGRTPKYDDEFVKEWLHGWTKSRAYFFTMSELGDALAEDLGYGSKTEAIRLVKKFGYRRVKQRVLPSLTPLHQEYRLEFCLEKYHFPADDRTVVAVVDEKYFYALSDTAVSLYVPPGVEVPAKKAFNKLHPAKIMFFAENVAEPRYIDGELFDGAIAFIPVVEEGEYQRAVPGKGKVKGDLKWDPMNMDRSKFVEVMMVAVEMACKKVHKWCNRLVFQMDNAGGHGGGTKALDAEGGVIPELIRLSRPFAREYKLKIEFEAQPAKSPDLFKRIGSWDLVLHCCGRSEITTSKTTSRTAR
jgi:transposase